MSRRHQSPSCRVSSLVDKFYYMIGPILPPRNHTLRVSIRKGDGSYQNIEVEPADQDDPQHDPETDPDAEPVLSG